MSKPSAAITVLSPIYIHCIRIPPHSPSLALQGVLDHYYICPLHSFYQSKLCQNLLLRNLLFPWPNLRLWQLLLICFIVLPWNLNFSIYSSSQSLFFLSVFSLVSIQINYLVILLFNGVWLVF